MMNPPTRAMTPTMRTPTTRSASPRPAATTDACQPWYSLGHSACWENQVSLSARKLHMHSLKVLKVIKCVGETLKQREAGSTMEVVAEQTKTIAGMTYKRSGYGSDGSLRHIDILCNRAKTMCLLGIIS